MFRILRTVLVLLISSSTFGRVPISGSRINQLTGTKQDENVKNIWDNLYNKSKYIYGKTPAKFLVDNVHYLPPSGTSILDLGMGEGRNAIYLAKKGYEVTGLDISPVAIKKAQLFSKEVGAEIKTVTASIDEFNFPPSSFDSIICFYFVDRKSIEKMIAWLKPGGVLFFEAFTINERNNKKISEPESHYLKPKEILSLFSKLSLLKFEEPTHLEHFSSSAIFKKEIL